MIDILAIRDTLNQQAFREGTRRTLIGRISDVVPVLDTDSDEEQEQAEPSAQASQTVSDYLEQLERELGQHDLRLERGVEDRDTLYAVQLLRSEANVDLSWMAEAMSWAYRITAVAIEMVLPGLIGIWLDARWGTSFLGWVGFLLGVPLGIWHLLLITKGRGKDRGSRTA